MWVLCSSFARLFWQFSVPCNSIWILESRYQFLVMWDSNRNYTEFADQYRDCYLNNIAPLIHEHDMSIYLGFLKFLTTLMAESEEELKSLLMKVKEESEKAGFKLTTFKKRRSWHPVPSLHSKKMGKQWKQWQTIFLVSKNHCRCWLQLWN